MTRRMGTDPTLNYRGLLPEILLAGAVLRQALSDARLDQPSQTNKMVHQQAVTFLNDQNAIDWWAELVGADGDVLGHTLRRAAGLEE